MPFYAPLITSVGVTLGSKNFFCNTRQQCDHNYMAYHILPNEMSIILTKIDAKCLQDCRSFKVGITCSLCKKITIIIMNNYSLNLCLVDYFSVVTMLFGDRSYTVGKPV